MKQNISNIAILILGLLMMVSGLMGTGGFLPDSGRIIFGIICLLYAGWKLLLGRQKEDNDKDLNL